MGLFDKLLKGGAAASADPATLPNDLAELRKLCDKAKWDKKYVYERKICEVGMDLFRQGKLVAQPGNPNDVSELLELMESFIDSCHTYTHYTDDPAFELQLLEAAAQMVDEFSDRKEKDPSVRFSYPVGLVQEAWKSLPAFYSEGKFCQRNTPAARKYLRMILTFQVKHEKKISSSELLQLFEVIAPGEDGKTELRKWITMDYGLQLARMQAKQQVRIIGPYENLQAAESLFGLNTDILGSGSAEEMLAEYRRGAAAGNAYAQYMLGKFYHRGRFVEADYAKAIELLTEASQQGLAVAVDALTMALMYPPEGISKQEAARYKGMYDTWIKRADSLLVEVRDAYAPTLAGAFRH